MDAAEWRDTVGTKLKKARGRTSKRRAAERAGFSEALWRQLEDGYRTVQQGLQVPINPRDETLEAAARAVGLDPAELFRIAGRDWQPTAPNERPALSVEERLTILERQVSDLMTARDEKPAMTAEDRDRFKELVRRGEAILASERDQQASETGRR